MSELHTEREKLKQTVKTIKEILEEEKQDLADLEKNFIGEIEELWRIAYAKNIHITNLETAIDKPYFARIDFVEEDTGKKNTIYIGKHGVMKDSNIVVTDWRAPISSLYYDAEVGQCSFESPSGTINGEMLLKRQFEIEDGELIEYFDVDLVSNDTLLQKYLNSNNDSRLKSIVSTIQKEQNAVIRKRLSDNLIIQGVAGSGKTTVALHRIAYLVYNYLNYVKQNQYLVIGPNPVFLKYIKSVLPDLDVSGVEQCTFEQFAKEYIDEDINVVTSDKKINASISGKMKNDIDKFKCSIYFKNMLDEFLKIFFQSLTINDLKLGEFVVLDKDTIREVFESTKNSESDTLVGRIEMTIERLCNLIEREYNYISTRYTDYTYEIFKAASPEEKIKLRTKFAKEREELNKNCRSLLRKYFAKAKVTPTKLYKLFISAILNFNMYSYKSLNILKKETLANIKDGNYDFEDLAALMYIKKCISPDRKYTRFKHVVVDEAQDLGEFNFFVLKSTLPKATFSIFGDLAQSIYDYRGINNWESVNNVMFDNEGEIINFTKSYRTTSQIMDAADDVSSSIGLGKSDVVVRHGKQVGITEAIETTDIPDIIAQKIMEFKAKGYKTIAVVSKTNLLSMYINDDLIERGINIPNVSVNDDLSEDRFSICTISNQLAKGLEFDAVIINNASEDIYSSNSSLDMKLLYVAITRALHELEVVYSGQLTKPLTKTLKRISDNENLKL